MQSLNTFSPNSISFPVKITVFNLPHPKKASFSIVIFCDKIIIVERDSLPANPSVLINDTFSGIVTEVNSTFE